MTEIIQPEKVVVVEPAHHPLFVDRWRVMRRWWSVRIGVLGVAAMAGIPALSDQFPNIAPSLISYFPKHGAQWVPILGAVIAIAARVISQEFIADRMRAFFTRQGCANGPQ
jgi:hypothetical protein